jgi:hypothetical protein
VHDNRTFNSTSRGRRAGHVRSRPLQARLARHSPDRALPCAARGGGRRPGAELDVVFQAVPDSGCATRGPPRRRGGTTRAAPPPAESAPSDPPGERVEEGPPPPTPRGLCPAAHADDGGGTEEDGGAGERGTGSRLASPAGGSTKVTLTKSFSNNSPDGGIATAPCAPPILLSSY